MDLLGGPIDKSIPLDEISKIADVGTGIGEVIIIRFFKFFTLAFSLRDFILRRFCPIRIWLDAAHDLLKDTPSERRLCYQGFDISDAQFPWNMEQATFDIQDVLKLFPAVHFSCYDLVHVRNLCGAIKNVGFKDFAANLMRLLSKVAQTWLSQNGKKRTR